MTCISIETSLLCVLIVNNLFNVLRNFELFSFKTLSYEFETPITTTNRKKYTCVEYTCRYVRFIVTKTFIIKGTKQAFISYIKEMKAHATDLFFHIIGNLGLNHEEQPQIFLILLQLK